MTDTSPPRHTLAEEHAELLAEVEARRQRVLLALERRRWPQPEIEGLLGYLRYELLDQAVNEERLLFPLARAGFADEGVRQLVADHARLRDCADALAQVVATDDAERDRGHLVVVLDHLRERLTRHLQHEQEVLAAATDSGVGELQRPYRSHRWYALTEGAQIDIDLLPHQYASAAIMDRLTRLRPGDCVELTSSESLAPVHRLIVRRDMAADHGWAYLEEGPQRWRAAVTRRGTPEGSR